MYPRIEFSVLLAVVVKPKYFDLDSFSWEDTARDSFSNSPRIYPLLSRRVPSHLQALSRKWQRKLKHYHSPHFQKDTALLPKYLLSPSSSSPAPSHSQSTPLSSNHP